MFLNKSRVASPETSSVFRNRFVQSILVSTLFLQIGIWIRNLAVLLYVMEKTNGDPFAISMISVAEYGPMFIFSFIGGTFADRWPPKRTMVCCDLLSSLSIFIVMFTLAFSSWKAVFFSTIASAILSQFSQPSGMKLFKTHLSSEQVQSGMSIYQTIFSLFMIIGPMLGTVVFQTLGITLAIALTGLAFVLSACSLLFLPSDQIVDKNKPHTSLLHEMVEGIRYLLSKRVLRLLGICFMSAGFGIGLIQPLNIFLVTERLNLPKESLQWLMTFNGSGMLLGGVLVMIFARAIAPQKLLALGMLVNGIGIAVSGISTIPWLTYVIQFIGGLFLPCVTIGINTMILNNTETQYIGRVNGILTPLFIGAMVVTMSIAGLLKSSFSLIAVYQVAGVLYIVGMLFILPLYNLPIITRKLEDNS